MNTLVDLSQHEPGTDPKNKLIKDFKNNFINVELSKTVKTGATSTKKVIVGMDDPLTLGGYFISAEDLNSFIQLIGNRDKKTSGIGVQFGYGQTDGKDNPLGRNTLELQLVISVVENFGTPREKVIASFTTAKIGTGGGTTIPSGGTKYPS